MSVCLRRFVSGVALLALGTLPSLAGDVLRWNVNQNTVSVGSGVALAVVPGISGSELRGGGTQGNAGSPAGTWNRTFSPATANFDAAQAAGHYFRFTTTVEAGYTLRISGITGLYLAKTSNGPTTAGLFISTDGGNNFTQTGTAFTTAMTLSSAAEAFGSTMTVEPIEIDGGAAGTTVHWRIVVFGGSGGRLGIGNGDTVDLALTEPTTGRLTVKNGNSGATPKSSATARAGHRNAARYWGDVPSFR